MPTRIFVAVKILTFDELFAAGEAIEAVQVEDVVSRAHHQFLSCDHAQAPIATTHSDEPSDKL